MWNFCIVHIIPNMISSMSPMSKFLSSISCDNSTIYEMTFTCSICHRYNIQSCLHSGQKEKKTKTKEKTMKEKRINDTFHSFRLIVLSFPLLSLVNSSSSFLLYTRRTLELLRLSSQLISSVKQTITYTHSHKEERIYENEKEKTKRW